MTDMNLTILLFALLGLVFILLIRLKRKESAESLKQSKLYQWSIDYHNPNSPNYDADKVEKELTDPLSYYNPNSKYYDPARVKAESNDPKVLGYE